MRKRFVKARDDVYKAKEEGCTDDAKRILDSDFTPSAERSSDAGPFDEGSVIQTSRVGEEETCQTRAHHQRRW
jgi:hypothetical protein